MANYYYFIPTLPGIRPDSGSFMSVDEFLGLCRTHISARDYRTLVTVVKGDGVVKGNRFVEAYSRLSTMLDRALTEERARALGLDEQEYRNDGEKTAFIQQAVRRAVSECNPLEAEELLLRLRFDFLDRNVGSGHRWDLTFLVCYALKLSLLSRRSAFTRERGSEEFERLTSQLRKEIFS